VFGADPAGAGRHEEESDPPVCHGRPGNIKIAPEDRAWERVQSAGDVRLKPDVTSRRDVAAGGLH
jgi:hypothetical protein